MARENSRDWTRGGARVRCFNRKSGSRLSETRDCLYRSLAARFSERAEAFSLRRMWIQKFETSFIARSISYTARVTIGVSGENVSLAIDLPIF